MSLLSTDLVTENIPYSNLAPRSVSAHGHKLFCGDCRAVLGLLREKSVDVVVTPPPYNLNIAYSTYHDRKTEKEYLAWFKSIASSLSRVLRKDGSFFLNIAGSGSRPWLPFELAIVLRNCDFVLQNHIIWIKSITTEYASKGHFKPISGERFLHQNHEHLLHLTFDGNRKLDRLAIGIPFQDKTNIARWGHVRDIRCHGNTWFLPYKTVQNRRQKFNHPAGFPTLLPLWCIWLHGKPGAVVLDPFAGSGTSLIAAHEAGAYGIAIEVDREYMQMAAQRLEEHVANTISVVLNDVERTELLKQDPTKANQGGFQSLLVTLQNKLNKTTGQLSISRDDAERIRRYAFNYEDGGWERMLKDIFARHLGPDLDRWPGASDANT